MNFELVSSALLLFLGFSFQPAGQLMPAFLSWSRISEAGTVREVVAVRVPDARPQQAPIRIVNDSLGVVLTAASALIVDKESGVILFEKNADSERTLASITKLMSLMVVRERLADFSTELEITKDNFIPLGFNNFAVGDVIPARDLFPAALIASDNTAMQTLARATGLSDRQFVEAMNAKAKDWGLTHTRFADQTGLSNENISTAREILIFTEKAFSIPEIPSLAGKRLYSFTAPGGKKFDIRTTNQLIGSMVTVIAGKTGYVTDAGYNLVAEVDRPGEKALMGVVLGSATTIDRFQDFKMMALWAWNNHEWPAP